MRKKETTAMSTHFNEFKTTLSHLQAQEVEFQDSAKTMFLLVTLLDSWDTFRTAINNSTPKNGLKCADIECSLLMEQLNCKNVDDSRSCKDVECYHCHKEGHVKKKDSYKWKNKQEKKNKDDKGKEKVNDSTNIVKIEELNALTFDSDGDVLYTSSLSTAFLVASNGSYEQDWIKDSGAPFHVTPHREWFSSCEGRHGIVRLGNNYACEIVGAGDIKMSLPNGSQFTLTNVRHVPKLTKSLIPLLSLMMMITIPSLETKLGDFVREIWLS
ncbi:hypothetical protein L7F22_039625 [Adiantum nelumboides]|nr:hypothetical protein [Adiantum nelumboides]